MNSSMNFEGIDGELYLIVNGEQFKATWAEMSFDSKLFHGYSVIHLEFVDDKNDRYLFDADFTGEDVLNGASYEIIYWVDKFELLPKFYFNIRPTGHVIVPLQKVEEEKFRYIGHVWPTLPPPPILPSGIG